MFCKKSREKLRKSTSPLQTKQVVYGVPLKWKEKAGMTQLSASHMTGVDLGAGGHKELPSQAHIRQFPLPGRKPKSVAKFQFQNDSGNSTTKNFKDTNYMPLEPFQTLTFTDWVEKENNTFRNMQIGDLKKVLTPNDS